MLLATRWAVTGSAEGRGGGPAARAPRGRRAWSKVSRLDRVRSQHAGLRVEEHQGVFLDADRNPAATQGIRGQDVAPGQVDRAVFADDPVDLDRRTRLGRGQRWGPAGRAPSAASAVRSAADRWERTVLIRAPAMSR